MYVEIADLDPGAERNNVITMVWCGGCSGHMCRVSSIMPHSPAVWFGMVWYGMVGCGGCNGHMCLLLHHAAFPGGPPLAHCPAE